jgi:septal ring factor EnvC (AmiA/AmiB activator)
VAKALAAADSERERKWAELKDAIGKLKAQMAQHAEEKLQFQEFVKIEQARLEAKTRALEAQAAAARPAGDDDDDIVERDEEGGGRGGDRPKPKFPKRFPPVRRR